MASLEGIRHLSTGTRIITIPLDRLIHMDTKGGLIDIQKNLEEIMITILIEENAP